LGADCEPSAGRRGDAGGPGYASLRLLSNHLCQPGTPPVNPGMAKDTFVVMLR
jgi:hypothetical protein